MARIRETTLLRFIKDECANYDKHYQECLSGGECKVLKGRPCGYFEKCVLGPPDYSYRLPGYDYSRLFAKCAEQTGAKKEQVKQRRWATKEQVKALSKGGGQTTLTPDIAARLASGWRLHIEDDDLCFIVGITHGQLRGWLQNNTQTTFIRSVPRLRVDGTPLRDSKGNEIVKRVTETVGLYDLRAREWASFEYNYMQKHDMLIDKAIAEKDYRTAMKGIQWVLAKRFPKKYGEARGIDVNANTTPQASARFEIDELNLPLETRKLILKKIRERRDNTTQSN